MCGVAGIIDLVGRRTITDGIIQRMTQAIIHRGPDEEGYFRHAGLVLGSRRLSIVGLADGQQPVFNEDRSVSVVFNGEFFNHLEKRAELDLQISLLAEHEITKLATLLSAIGERLGVETDVDAEVEELKQDVAPEAVLDKIEERRE